MDFSVLQCAGSGYKGSDNFSPEPDPHLPSLFNLGNKILLQNVAITLWAYFAIIIKNRADSAGEDIGTKSKSESKLKVEVWDPDPTQILSDLQHCFFKKL